MEVEAGTNEEHTAMEGVAGGYAYIEQFKILAKTTSGRATAAIVEKVMKHKQIYVFSEILELDCVQKLKDTELGGTFRALEIMAFGVYSDYVREKDSLPPFAEVQERKLRQLTIVDLANKLRVIPYEKLFSALAVSTPRVLEDLIIDSIYSGLVQGKLNHREQLFHVEKVMGRDTRPEDIDKMISDLQSWCSRSKELMEKLEETMNYVQSTQEASVASEKANLETLSDAFKQACEELTPASAMQKTMLQAGITSTSTSSSSSKRRPPSPMDLS